jgi:5-formyltetrahydrofolate cyclo-ligase
MGPSILAAVDAAKQRIRAQVWDALERVRATEPGVHGHIPAFARAAEAAARLATHPAWHAAQVVKANPDSAQVPVRAYALESGKTVYMAVPNLASDQPFYLLDPRALTMAPTEAATHRVAATFARTVAINEMPPIEVVVCGSVAVSPDGVRVGKGAGYSDLEIALLVEAGLIGPNTPIVTTVHELQVISGPLPETAHDFRVDIIVTPDVIIECPPGKRPNGIIWGHLTRDQIDAVPALARHPARPENGSNAR